MTPALQSFGIAPVALLEERALLRRVDRKFVMPRSRINDLLTLLVGDYLLLPAGEALTAGYRTRYFDTDDWQMYHDHRRGRFPRFKIRLRHHDERQVSFLEVKSRRLGAVSAKARLPRPFGEDVLDSDALAFLHRSSPYATDRLRLIAGTDFTRATLLGVNVAERVTIDWNLELSVGPNAERLHDLAIVEVKQGAMSNRTPAMAALRQLRLRERGLSKYCVAVARLTSNRSNSLKPSLRSVETLS